MTRSLPAVEENARIQRQGMRELCRQLLQMHPSALASLDNAAAWLAKLLELAPNTIILIAAKDTPGGAIPDAMLAQLAQMGLKVNPNEHFRCGYVAVIDGGNVELELTGASALELGLKTGAREIVLFSAPFGPQNAAQIVVDGIDLAVNWRGLNMVVLDKGTGVLMDSVNLDTFLPDVPLSRQG